MPNMKQTLLNLAPDSLFLKWRYWRIFGRRLNLRRPKTYNEKLQWLKLHDRNPVYTMLVDKIEVKDWVAKRIGEEHVLQTIQIWDDVDDIDITNLPDQFVLKTNHDSGGIVICRDKELFDLKEAKKLLKEHFDINWYYMAREWPYKDVRPRVFAEVYLADYATGDLPDYKFFCFDGEAKALFVATERFAESETKFDFFDMDFNHLPFRNGHPNSDKPINKPKHFDEMRAFAERLSFGLPHVRVDFYETDAGVYFGEMTFSHWAGFVPFEPEEWDEIFGSWLKLPPRS